MRDPTSVVEPTLVRALPKVELHLHIEGAAPAATVADLARRHGVDLGLPAGAGPDEIAALYRYRNLRDFLRVFDLVCRCLADAESVHRVAYEALARSASAGVRRSEAFFSPEFTMRHGLTFRSLWEGLRRAVLDARSDYGLDARLVMDVHKPGGRGPAMELIERAAACDRDLLIGVGGDGGEHGVDLRALAEPFAAARRAGLRTTLHVAEEGPAGDVAIAVRELGVERIDHGVRLLDDPELAAEVAERRIPLTVCPTSNVRIGLYRSHAEHPFPRLRTAGVLATVHADNAAMFGIDIADEYQVCVDVFGYGVTELRALCLDAVEASWADEGERARLRSEMNAAFAELTAPVAPPDAHQPTQDPGR